MTDHRRCTICESLIDPWVLGEVCTSCSQGGFFVGIQPPAHPSEGPPTAEGEGEGRGEASSQEQTRT